MNMEFKNKLDVIGTKMSTAYFKILDMMHRPFLRSGANDPYHVTFQEFISTGAKLSSPTILEIGSRNVTGVTRRHLFPTCEKYVGFDIHEGSGVDVVGDVHKLSTYFPKNHFDLVYTVAVFEHLLFPWKVALEINKVMKVGGYLFVGTVSTWPTHELPWDFWRYQYNGFHSLFNKYTGFDIVSIGEGLPCKAYSLVDDIPTRGICNHTLNQGVAVIARKSGDYREDLLRWDIETSDVVLTMYPNNKSK